MKSKDEWQVGDIVACHGDVLIERRLVPETLYCIDSFNIGYPSTEKMVRNIVTVDKDGRKNWWSTSDLEYVCGGGIEELKRLSEL